MCSLFPLFVLFTSRQSETSKTCKLNTFETPTLADLLEQNIDTAGASMQGLLDTAEREFRVAGWNTPTAPVPDAGHEPKNRSSASIVPQANRDARRRQSSKSVASHHEVPETSPERTPTVQSVSDASNSGDRKASFLPNGACSGSSRDVSSANGGYGESEAATPGGKNYTGGTGRKRQRVQSELDGGVSRATPSPPKRPGGEACPRPGELSAGSNEDDSESLPLHEGNGTGKGE